MKPPLNIKYSDDFQTPATAIKPLLNYLKREWVIWEPAQGKGNLTRALISEGFKVIGSDILEGKDFLAWQPEYYDCIVTNPPYSLKNQFLERVYSLQKPFAFLLPLTTLETDRRQRLFKKYGLQIILLNKRINFETPSGSGSGSWFATAWFTNGLNLPHDINYS